jgi:hypothetical protein
MIVGFCVIYFAVAGVTAYKLAKKQQHSQTVHHDSVSEILKANGIYDIYNINGRDVN